MTYNSPIRNDKLLREAYESGRRQALNEEAWDYADNIGNPYDNQSILLLLDFAAWLFSTGLITEELYVEMIQGIVTGQLTYENLEGSGLDWWDKWHELRMQEQHKGWFETSPFGDMALAAPRPTQGIDHGGPSPQIRESYEAGRRDALNEQTAGYHPDAYPPSGAPPPPGGWRGVKNPDGTRVSHGWWIKRKNCNVSPGYTCTGPDKNGDYWIWKAELKTGWNEQDAERSMRRKPNQASISNVLPRKGRPEIGPGGPGGGGG